MEMNEPKPSYCSAISREETWVLMAMNTMRFEYVTICASTSWSPPSFT